MNDKEFDTDLLDVGGMFRRSKSYFITNGGKIIAAITLIISVVVMFTNVTFKGFSSYEFFLMLFLMLLSSYIMFFSLEDAGERLGEESEGFKAALEKYTAARAKIRSEDIAPMRDFCTHYSLEELEYRRTSLLCEHGYTREEYEQYRNGGTAHTPRAARTFRACDRMRAAALTPEVLMSFEHSKRRSELINPERYKLPYLCAQLIPSTICMAFTVSVILSTKDGMSVSSVLDGIFKLTALPIVGLRGYSEGYSYVKNSKSAWLETKARLLELFIARQGK